MGARGCLALRPGTLGAQIAALADGSRTAAEIAVLTGAHENYVWHLSSRYGDRLRLKPSSAPRGPAPFRPGTMAARVAAVADGSRTAAEVAALADVRVAYVWNLRDRYPDAVPVRRVRAEARRDAA